MKREPKRFLEVGGKVTTDPNSITWVGGAEEVTMPVINYDEPKSARVITNIDEIARLLYERREKGGGLASGLIVDADEGPVVMKDATFSTLTSPPKLDASEIEALARKAGIEFTSDHVNRVVSYWASDERVDGDGDIIRQVWDFSRFEKNPVLCDSHAWGCPPIGSGLKWGVVQRADADYSGPALFIAGLFPTAEESEQGDRIFRLVKSGFLRGGSVGFRGLAIMRVEDPAERQKLGLGQYGVVFEKSLLVEFSPTTIGSNPGAHTSLSKAKREGNLLADDVPTMRELVRREAVARKTKAEKWAETDAGLLAVCKSLFPDHGFKRHADMAEPIVKDEGASVSIPVEQPKTVAEDVAAIRASLDELGPAILRRFDDLEEQNAALKAKLEGIEARGTEAIAAELELPDPAEVEPTFEISPRLARRLARLKSES